MAIAVFGDIHGNLEALEAILKHIKKNKKITQTYFLGDAIVFGPDSSACLKLLKKHNVLCVLGNHEQRISKYDETATAQTYANKQHLEYVFSSLDKDDLRFVQTMPIERKLTYKDNFKILFTHYHHDENGKVVDEQLDFSEKTLRKTFRASKCDAVFFGHLHKRKILIDEEQFSYILQGSSGCVKGEQTFYTYFDINHSFGEEPNFDIYRVDVKFNRKKFESKMKALDLPGKESYAEPCFGITINKDQGEHNG